MLKLKQQLAMKNNILATLFILLIILGLFFAVFLRKSTASKPTIQLPDILKIGILGESRSEGKDELSFNIEVLNNLFTVLNKFHIDAIFFTGNLTFGWRPQYESFKKENKPDINYSKDILKKPSKTKSDALYDPKLLRSQLHQFRNFVDYSFNYPIAFYPAMGNHEAIGPHSTEIFQNELDLKNIIITPIGELRYTVSIGNSFFAVISTNYYDAQQNKIIEHAVSQDTLIWLENALKEARLKHSYLFVIGHEPAFSTQSIFNKRFGLDNNPQQRDVFWNILKKYKVLAYFSSHEQVYDRSDREGVWQVISGGAGSPLNEGEEHINAFFHCLLLTIPQKDSDPPSVTVLDEEGNVRDFFKLNQEKQTLHQFRISKSL